MATYTLMKDELKTCPYNPNHKVASRRLQAHIVKCSRNLANPVLVDCPFNALHKVTPEELKHHILLCKDSKQVIREMEEARNRPPEATNRPVAQPRTELPPSSDNWDDDIDESKSKSYVIPGLVRGQVKEEEGEGSEEKPFKIKSNIEIQCMKPAERKKYYKELADRAKSKTLPDPTHKTRTAKQEASSSTTESQSPVKSEDGDDPNNVRRPAINPFQRGAMGGIGRGTTPSGGGGIGRGRGFGIGRGLSFESPHSREANVKREPNDYPSPKRFSPDN